MPKSRKRKKKKKLKRAKKRATPKMDREVYEYGSTKLIREGKNVILSNNRTPEEQKEHLERLRESRPQQLADLQKCIDRVEEIFHEFDNLKLLGALSYYQFENQFNPEDDGLSELHMEYALSISTAIENNPANEPSPEVVSELIDLLTNIRHGYMWYILSEGATDKYSELEGKLRFHTMTQSLYVRGEGYTTHILSIYDELFSGHDDLLKDKYGFTSKEILDTIHQLEDSFCCRVVLPNGFPHPALHSRFVEWSKGKMEGKPSFKKDFINQFAEENPDVITHESKLTGFRINDMETYPELFRIRIRYEFQNRVIKALSQKFGENADFLNPKYKGMPLNDSATQTHPIIEYDGDYYMYSFSLVIRNLFILTESLIKEADETYYNEKFLGNKYSNSRDNFLENKAAALFKLIIPKSDSFLNLKYKPGEKDEHGNLIETELDLLIVSDKANYLVEMKAGGLSSPSKRGALKSLSGQLKDSVGYGAYQSFRAFKYINESENPIFYDSKNKITLDKANKTFRITITLDHLADLITYMYDLKELKILDTEVDFAWTCSLFDLIIFSEILEDETDFIDYLEKRLPFYQRAELRFTDEIDILGYFLEHDLELDEKKIEKMTMFQLNKYSDAIDRYFEKGDDKPRRKKKSS